MDSFNIWYKLSLAWKCVSHVMTFDLALYLQGHSTLFWLGTQHDSIVWVIMRQRGVSSERSCSSCSSCSSWSWVAPAATTRAWTVDCDKSNMRDKCGRYRLAELPCLIDIFLLISVSCNYRDATPAIRNAHRIAESMLTQNMLICEVNAIFNCSPDCQTALELYWPLSFRPQHKLLLHSRGIFK